MIRPVHHRFGIAVFEHFAAVKNADIIAQMMRHRKVVGDHEQGEVKFLANLEKKVEQFGLFDSVESLGESVTDEQVWSREQGSGERGLLSLDRVEFDRVELSDRLGESAGDHDGLDTTMPFLLVVLRVPESENFAERLVQGKIRRELAKAWGKNRLETFTDAAKLTFVESIHIDLGKGDASRRDRMEFHYREHKRMLSTFLLPDQAQATTFLDTERDLVDEQFLLQVVVEPPSTHPPLEKT